MIVQLIPANGWYRIADRLDWSFHKFIEQKAWGLDEAGEVHPMVQNGNTLVSLRDYLADRKFRGNLATEQELLAVEAETEELFVRAVCDLLNHPKTIKYRDGMMILKTTLEELLNLLDFICDSEYDLWGRLLKHEPALENSDVRISVTQEEVIIHSGN
jgi:hypothetical protein